MRRLVGMALEVKKTLTPRARSRVSKPRRINRVVIPLLALFALVAGVLFWHFCPRHTTLARKPGQFVPDFQLIDVRTRLPNRLSDHRGNVVVVVFVGTNCPVGDLYMPRLVELAGLYETRAVDFLAINSNESESIDEIAEHGRRSGVTFPILKDPENRVADQLLAERTCEALVIDAAGRLCYRGAIDDQYGLGARRDSPARDYLKDAIDSILAGRAIVPDLTHVVGCPIERTAPKTAGQAATRRAEQPRGPSPRNERPRMSPARDASAKVTYAAGVASILHNRCATCHRPGQVAPFSLLTFEQARRWSTSIAEVIADGRMPPWHADPRYGHFSNARGLTENERSLLTAWVEQGAPPGDLSQAPDPPKFPQGWSIGTPDFVFEIPESFTIPAEGTLPIQHFRIKTELKEDIWIQAAEARPSDRAVVHHIFVYMETYRQGRTRMHKDKVFLTAYTPGDVPSIFPPGVAKKIPAGADLAFEVHYTPLGRVRYDRTSVGVIISKQPPPYLAITRGLPQRNLSIPPGATDHVERADWKTRSDVQLLSFMPHMHLRGKSFTYTAHYPDGRSEILLSVPNYDFNWQNVYRLAEPKHIPKGTTVLCEAHYDNSAANLANPDPTRTVKWGEQTWDEMLIGYLDYIEDQAIQTGSPLPVDDD
jgi:peroxiredoxin/mono/diheme cytochrome c family protein